MNIKYATNEDIAKIAAVEAECFPPAEAATEKEFAGKLICRAIDEARQQGCKGLVLTCKEKLVPYYAKFGFSDEGVSDKSTHGNVVWHQMRLAF